MLWFAITLALAVLVEQISNIVSLTGGLAATFIFVFPGDYQDRGVNDSPKDLV